MRIIQNRLLLARILTQYLSKGTLSIPENVDVLKASLQLNVHLPCVGTIVVPIADSVAVDMLAQLQNCHEEREAILAEAFDGLMPDENWR